MSAFSPSVGKNTYLNTSIGKSWMFFQSVQWDRLSPAAAETSCYSELWSRELRFPRPRPCGSEVWCLRTSVEGQPHVLYVLWEARHSVETFRFHPWKKTNGKPIRPLRTVWSCAHCVAGDPTSQLYLLDAHVHHHGSCCVMSFDKRGEVTAEHFLYPA